MVKRDRESESDSDGVDAAVQNVEVVKRPQKRVQLLAQDVQAARETAELFKSNIFKLQIDELVKELRLKEAHCKLIERVLHRLYEVVQQIPQSEAFSLEQAEKHFAKSKNKVAIPFPDPKPTAINYALQYQAPSDVSLVGSFGLKTGIQQPDGMAIDVAVTMPKSLFQPKDYLNYKALYKRAFYVAYLADQLITLTAKHHLPVRISYEYVNGDRLCPSIRIDSISPDKKHPDDLVFQDTKFKIRLLVGLEYGLFESKKLLPDRNCIRIQTEDELPPTPLYNASILSSTTYKYYLKYLYATKKSTEAFRDATALGKLWLKQHGLGSHFNKGGFGHFELAMLMSALLNGGGESGNKILLHGYSSYQLFKGTIKYLATQDLLKDGYLSFTSTIGDGSSVYKKGGFNVPTLFDKTTKINIFWKMTPSSYLLLKKQAAETLDLLNDVVQDRFRQIFILKNTQKYLHYDTLVSVPLKTLDQHDKFGSIERIMFLTYENFVTSKIYRLVTRALGERANQVAVSVSATEDRWSVQKRHPEPEDKSVEIGLFLNASESENKVTKGPLHEDEENAVKFRSFWGSKAQVRRYKDGNIQYSCLWPANELAVVSILNYVFELHIGPNVRLEYSSSKFWKMLPVPLTSNAVQLIPPNFQSLKTSYNELCKVLNDIELPLAIKSILPASPALRNTSTILPVPLAVGNPDFFNESIIQFETSTKWPDELLALEQTKTAFLLKINQHLAENTEYKSYLEKDETSVPYNSQIKTLNIISPDGYGFRFYVLTERDEVLYLRAIENSSEKQKKTVSDIYLAFNQKYMGSVKHHRAIASLSTHFPLYSATVRLFKRWLDAQLLLSHFSDELVELLVMKVFVDPAPYSVPSSIESGFLRTLQFLSQWNWKEDPLVLDLAKDLEKSGNYIDLISDKLTVQSYQAMLGNFAKVRKEDPQALKTQFFVASKEDLSGRLWSLGLSLPIATRLTALSKAAVNAVSKSLDSRTLKLVFTPALKDYDFVLRIKTPTEYASKTGLLLENKFKNLVSALPAVDDASGEQDPVGAYCRELRARFGNVLVVSCGKYTGLSQNGQTNVVAGLLNPVVAGSKKKFRVNLGYDVEPIDDDQLQLNRAALLAQIVHLGSDLVESVDLNRV
ncbi:hypothetical protein OGAPHI_004726 [Ogataea philodendri]|uniref:U3 small nucleolar RNA-associated protein 22 n=1 Tax=Ogataea philodendri TaxID=1378263 RepID=A0A9P8P2J7_9ASCO|nr:uncharacterized protein OGAPHI_004726 [Ogataea philodendri]KAH3664012.1 hypothetical protein OGAPHI_004726 [Ogataea philodendri]